VLPRELDTFFIRPPVEDYVRASVQIGTRLFEPAVEWHDTDELRSIGGGLTVGTGFDAVVARLEECCAGWPLEDEQASPIRIAKYIGARIAAAFPGRAYFVEAWQEGRKGFAQVFQPFGVPKNR